nr:hypothetical protein [Candidatus Gracilibacteria bacterium]
MKKVIILLCVILGIVSINTSYAATTTSTGYLIKSDVNIYKIYKETVLSRHQIKLDFKDGDKLNSIIEKYFINVYLSKDRKQKLDTLERNLSNVLQKLEAKKPLTINQKKIFNLARNLYLRTILELRKKN